MKSLRKTSGFTLIELLVVIAVIGILAAVVLASLNSARTKARDSQRISQLREVQKALEMYYADNGSYPNSAPAAGCTASVWNTPLGALVSGGYISSVPQDPLNVATDTDRYCYNYYSSANSSSYQCNGANRSNYQYVIMFSLENANNSFAVASNTAVPEFDYCVIGPRK